jgi:dihydroorotate dehydrogenase (fumarate)
MIDLTTRYLGLVLKNPIIAGSSGLTDNIDSLMKLENAGVSAIVLKSLFEEEIIQEMMISLKKMNSEMFLYPETVDYYEHMDTPKESPKDYLELISEAKQVLKIPVIASINCLSAGQWTYFPKRIETAGADALELNLFIMPTDFNRTSVENENMYFEIIKEVRKQTNIPVALKVSYHFSNLGSILTKFSESGIQGLVLFNRFFNPDIDINNMTITQGHVLSSPSEIALTLRWIAIMSNKIKCSLAASTGIHDGEAMIKQLLAGADAVQIASVLYKRGLIAIPEMLLELEKWMKKNNFKTLNDFKGKLSRMETTNPALFDRFQFMKYFREMKPLF